MERFEYEITKHPAEKFNKLVYFCSEVGECSLEQVSADQTRILEDLLNERGNTGWELIQIFFRQDGILSFWKRKLIE